MFIDRCEIRAALNSIWGNGGNIGSTGISLVQFSSIENAGGELIFELPRSYQFGYVVSLFSIIGF